MRVPVAQTTAARIEPPATARGIPRSVLRYGAAVLLVAVAHLIVASAPTLIGPAMTSVFLAAVIISALYGGRGPGLVATLLAALDLDYTFTPPYHSFALVFDDILWLVVFTAVALLTSSLQARRLRAEDSLRAAHRGLETQVRERTAQLQQSQEQLALLVNGVPSQAVFGLDTQGKVASWNAGAERLLGYTAEEILGKHLSALLPDFGVHSRFEDQCWVTRKDGSRFWSAVLLTRVQDANEVPRGFGVSIRDVTDRKTLEQEVVEISDREQQRIGHDLHDGLGQELSGIAMLATALAEQLEPASPAAAEDAEQVADLVHEAIKHTRDLARGLCPLDLEGEGLAFSLRNLAQRVSRLPGITCTFDGPTAVRTDVLTASHLYRIAQEAIHNAIRHGKARHIAIQLSDSSGQLTLTVSDDGIGMPQNGFESGMGLRLIGYRARAIRGRIQISGGPQGGTMVQCRIDLSTAVSHG